MGICFLVKKKMAELGRSVKHEREMKAAEQAILQVKFRAGILQVKCQKMCKKAILQVKFRAGNIAGKMKVTLMAMIKIKKNLSE